MYVWACGSTRTAACNMHLVIPSIRWLGATSDDLRAKNAPPVNIKSDIDDLLQKPWVLASDKSIQQWIMALAQGTGRIADVAGEFELGNVVMRKIQQKRYWRVEPQTAGPRDWESPEE